MKKLFMLVTLCLMIAGHAYGADASQHVQPETQRVGWRDTFRAWRGNPRAWKRALRQDADPYQMPAEVGSESLFAIKLDDEGQHLLANIYPDSTTLTISYPAQPVVLQQQVGGTMNMEGSTDLLERNGVFQKKNLTFTELESVDEQGRGHLAHLKVKGTRLQLHQDIEDNYQSVAEKFDLDADKLKTRLHMWVDETLRDNTLSALQKNQAAQAYKRYGDDEHDMSHTFHLGDGVGSSDEEPTVKVNFSNGTVESMHYYSKEDALVIPILKELFGGGTVMKETYHGGCGTSVTRSQSFTIKGDVPALYRKALLITNKEQQKIYLNWLDKKFTSKKWWDDRGVFYVSSAALTTIVLTSLAIRHLIQKANRKERFVTLLFTIDEAYEKYGEEGIEDALRNMLLKEDAAWAWNEDVIRRFHILLKKARDMKRSLYSCFRGQINWVNQFGQHVRTEYSTDLCLPDETDKETVTLFEHNRDAILNHWHKKTSIRSKMKRMALWALRPFLRLFAGTKEPKSNNESHVATRGAGEEE